MNRRNFLKGTAAAVTSAVSPAIAADWLGWWEQWPGGFYGSDAMIHWTEKDNAAFNDALLKNGGRLLL